MEKFGKSWLGRKWENWYRRFCVLANHADLHDLGNDAVNWFERLAVPTRGGARQFGRFVAASAVANKHANKKVSQVCRVIYL